MWLGGKLIEEFWSFLDGFDNVGGNFMSFLSGADGVAGFFLDKFLGFSLISI